MYSAELTLINKSKYHSITSTIPLSTELSALKAINNDGINYGVYENDDYEIALKLSDNLLEENISSINLTINGFDIGQFILSAHHHSQGYYWGGNTKYPRLKDKPFFLFYDQITIGIQIVVNDWKTLSLLSPNILCQSSITQHQHHIQAMIESLTDKACSDIIALMFPQELNKDRTSSLTIKSFNKLIGKVVTCYKSNFIPFTSQAKYSYEPILEPTSPNHLRTISPISFQYLAQDPCYTPSNQTVSKRIPAVCKIKNFKIKENIQICIFLAQVLQDAINIHNELACLIKDKMRANSFSSHQLQFPLEKLNYENLSSDLGLLYEQIIKLKQVKNQYEKLFGFNSHDKALKEGRFASLPPSSNVYQQIAPYHHVYSCMKDYFEHESCNLNKERLILEAKTLDSLFEYYCLYCLINMLISHGFTPDNNQRPINYQYRINRARNVEVKKVANTYVFNKPPYSITLYYQPIVSGSYIENHNMLFRMDQNNLYSSIDTQDADFNFYNPDFVLKIASSEICEYLIFDAKYSTGDTIIKTHINNLIEKYCLNIASISLKQLSPEQQQSLDQKELSLYDLCGLAIGTKPPKMMYALQGKSKINERYHDLNNHVWHYHQSPIAQLIAPPTKIGVIELNSSNNNEELLWEEICSALPALKEIP